MSLHYIKVPEVHNFHLHADERSEIEAPFSCLLQTRTVRRDGDCVATKGSCNNVHFPPSPWAMECGKSKKSCLIRTRTWGETTR
ncbi:YD repeat-containing protein [Anopheles sinensis]|uniref:YD repeat-containing protein n=1 Tax=Anopheles sinensis TaxID=74873 RepID=A0A084VXF0_ANOSI|nr:YD repeat-containing protein [Anopheles sinensis]